MEDKNLKIDIGDIVKVCGEDDSLFIVLDIYDFSDEEITVIDFELVRIYPQTIKMRLSNESLDDISLFEKRGTDSYNRKMKILKEEREELGWRKAEYIEILEDTLIEIIPTDEVDYSSFKTIDECLDTINDLNILYNELKDEKYLEKKGIVVKRLIILSQ